MTNLNLAKNINFDINKINTERAEFCLNKLITFFTDNFLGKKYYYNVSTNKTLGDYDEDTELFYKKEEVKTGIITSLPEFIYRPCFGMDETGYYIESFNVSLMIIGLGKKNKVITFRDLNNIDNEIEECFKFLKKAISEESANNEIKHNINNAIRIANEEIIGLEKRIKEMNDYILELKKL